MWNQQSGETLAGQPITTIKVVHWCKIGGVGKAWMAGFGWGQQGTGGDVTRVDLT